MNDLSISEKRKRLSEYFESTDPELFLTELSKGIRPTADDLIVIATLNRLGLKDGVINVLIDYVTKFKSKNTLPFKYVVTVALDWSNKRIETSDQAMEHVIKLHSKKLNKPE